MQLNQLRCFVMAAHCGSITKAAQQLFVTQSAVSQAISSLEDELGIRLFDTTSKSISLSAIGKKCLLNAQMVLDGCNLIKHDCEQANTGKKTVSIMSRALPGQLPQIIRGFYAAHPGIAVVSHPASSETAEISIRTTLDANFTNKRRLIITEELGIVVPTAHPLFGQPGIALRELAPYPIISLDASHDLRAEEDYFCGLAGFTPVREHDAATITELLELVYAEQGVVFFPFKTWGIETINTDRIIRITDPVCYRHICIEQRLNPDSDEDSINLLFNYLLNYFAKYWVKTKRP